MYRSPYPLFDDTIRAMTSAYHESNDAGHDDGSGYFWPSTASIELTTLDNGHVTRKIEGQCQRRVWYAMKGFKETDPPGQRLFDAGTFGSALEDIYAARFHRVPEYRIIYPNVLGRKIRFRNSKTRLSGELDIVMEHIETGDRFGIDIKSYDGVWKAIRLAGWDAAEAAHGESAMPKITKYTQWKKLGKKSPLNWFWVEMHSTPPAPSIDNVLQVMLYLEQFRNDTKPIHLFKLAYVARDRGPEVEFDITLQTSNGMTCAVINDELHPELTLEAIHARFHALSIHIDNNTVPPRDYVPEYNTDAVLDNRDKSFTANQVKTVKQGGVHRDWRCTFCPFLTKCLNESSDTAIF